MNQSRRQIPSPPAPIERPLSFATDMLRAVRNGIKTQTRRPCYPQSVEQRAGKLWRTDGREIVCPFGVAGDRLWVRERFAVSGEGVVYSADPVKKRMSFQWQQSRYLPREFSRVLLEVLATRPEQLQSITETDALSEGHPEGEALAPIAWFHRLWDRLTMAEPLRWAANPWVWVVTFRVIEGRIDSEKVAANEAPLFAQTTARSPVEVSAKRGGRSATIEEKRQLATLLKSPPNR